MKKTVSWIMVVLGVLLLAGGFVLLKTVVEPEGIMLPLPYICIGVGCGVFGHGMGDILSKRAMKKNPKLAKKVSVEEKDERNVTIGNMAKAKAYDMMIFVFGALMLSFSLMNVELVVILLFVAAYLFVVGYGVYYRIKLDKEMSSRIWGLVAIIC